MYLANIKKENRKIKQQKEENKKKQKERIYRVPGTFSSSPKGKRP